MSKFTEVKGVDPLHLPSEFQEGLWGASVIAGDGTDQNGSWHGWCPLHDNVMDPDLPSALFNFATGVLVCNGEPSCHEGKRAISLTNVLTRMYAHDKR
jgi:hypothetical protein